MAAIQAWIAVVAGRNSRHRRLDRGPWCRFRTSPAGSTRADMTVTLENMTRTVDGIPTIRNVSLTLERGTLSVLLGPTLSGKTSIMRLLAGLDKPATGRVLVDGRSEEHTSELQSLRHLVCRLLLEKKKRKVLATQAGVRFDKVWRMKWSADRREPSCTYTISTMGLRRKSSRAYQVSDITTSVTTR